MRLLTSRCGSLGLPAVWALLGAALLIAGCGGDEEQVVAQAVGAQAQQQVTEQIAEQSAEDEEAAAASQSVSQAEDEPEAQQENGVDAAAEQSEEASQRADATEQAAAQESQESEEQAGGQTQAAEAQQSTAVEGVAEEAVAEGTRLITLFGDLTEIVYALEAEEYLVARDTSSIYPAAAAELPNLGFAGALNAEAILALTPTLVIGRELAGPEGVLEQLREAGVEVVLLDELTGLDAPQIKIRAIGAALGIPQRAEALAQDVEHRLAGVTAELEEPERPLRVLLLYVRRGGIQQTGDHARTIIETAGGIDAAAEAGVEGWQALTPEALVAIDPEVYLVLDLGLEVVGGIEGLMEIPGVAETRAGRARRVISMPDLYLLGFGPRLPEAIADLSAYLRAVEAEIGSG